MREEPFNLGYSLYGYVLNNPLRFFDPDGRGPVLVGGGVLAVLIPLALACAYANGGLALNKDFPKAGDKWKHCVISCRMSKNCGGVISQIAQLGKEFADLVSGDPILGILEDLAANQQCVYWESLLGGPVCSWIGGLIRENCEKCCTRDVGYSDEKWKGPDK